jgi:hypothetical protein
LEDWKIKIAVLWIVFEFCMFTLSTVEFLLYHMEEMIVETTTPELIMVLVIVTLIPPLMAFMSLTLKDAINRWLNIILGIVFIVLMPIGVIAFPTAYMPSIIVIAIVEIVALALIVWYAWKSKQKT